MKKNSLLVISIISVLFAGCGLVGGSGGGKGGAKNGKGQLIGAQERDKWSMAVPFGMSECPGGTYTMGQTDEDVAAAYNNLNRQVTVMGFLMDDSEITNNEYRQFINAMLEDSIDVFGIEFISKELYPDTTVWKTDFLHHLSDPMLEYYYSHPAYDDYPVVGVDWEAATLFCKWRTEMLREYRNEEGLWTMPQFRLPSEAEWEWAARGGRDMAKYPWGGPYVANAKGCYLANFKPGRGNYYNDGFQYTSPVKFYPPNDFGLYDMAGNVAEWCADAYNEASVPVVSDADPLYVSDEPMKVVRGGSWKDIAYYLQTGTRSYEHKDTTHSFIGFRCVMTAIGQTPK